MLLIVVFTVFMIISEELKMRKKEREHDGSVMIEQWRRQREERDRRIKEICENNNKIWNNK